MIEMLSSMDYRYILRVVDHFSTNGYVGEVKKKRAQEISEELIFTVIGSIMPDVLQSDNGREVSNLLTTSCHFWDMHAIN